LSKYQGDPIIKSRLEQFRKKHKKKCAIIPRASDEEKSKMKVIGNDKDILNDAIKTKSKKIVTMDKKFVKKGNGYEGVEILSPKDYTKSKKRKRKD